MAAHGEAAMAAIDQARSHPLRRQIMGVMMGEKAPLAPVDFHRGNGAGSVTLGTTAYHFRTLESLGMIDKVDEGRVKGAIVSYFRPSKAFTPEIADGVALDLIADELDLMACDGSDKDVGLIARIVATTGRPVILSADDGGESDVGST
jgi:hypothetical protein